MNKPHAPATERVVDEPPPHLRMTELWVRNFKSLADFRLPMADFTCLIGLNGSGKSSALQAVDFLSHLFEGEVSDWLQQRQWKASDLNSKLVKARNIVFVVVLQQGEQAIAWGAHFNRVSLKCTKEVVSVDGDAVFQVADGTYALKQHEGASIREPIAFEYEGSILSLLKEDLLPPEVLAIKTFFRRTASLDLLAPQLLRKKTDASHGGLGLGGERLSAFIHELSPAKRAMLSDRLEECYPQLSRVFTRSLRAGWKELNVREQFGDFNLVTEARHVNDGMLRLIAILAELLTDNEFLLFDEIENGINPELVEFLIDELVGARQQVLVTTHSPMILNYLDDDVARAGVQYLYRTDKGFTQSVPFFDIPSVSEKLEVMGPGEAFVDTDLTRLQDEIRTLPKAPKDEGNADPR